MPLSRLRHRFPWLWPRQCAACGRGVRRYTALPADYQACWLRHGFPYTAADFETLNAAEYSCPWCGASDRDRLMALYLRSLPADTWPGGAMRSVLEIAPAPALSEVLRRLPRTRYRSADLLMPGVEDRIDIQDMRCYRDGEWDLIVCSHVLEHVRDECAALAELRRVLEPTAGICLLLVPIILGLPATIADPDEQDEAARWRRFGQGDHVRLHAKADFCARVAQAGLAVEQVTTARWTPRVVRRAGLSPTSVLYIAKRAPHG